MALSLQEQEVCINACRMDKLVSKSPNLFKVVAETDYSKTYKFPKRLISIRSSIREMSDEQKAAASERLMKLREENRI